MAASRYPGGHASRRDLFIIECVLGLSVIVGLGFVTVRVMHGGLIAPSTPTAQTATVVLPSDAPPPAQDGPDNRTP